MMLGEVNCVFAPSLICFMVIKTNAVIYETSLYKWLETIRTDFII